MAGGTWRGDWEARMREAIARCGHETATAFAAARPRALILELVAELGPGDVNGAQLITMLRDEAERAHALELFARGLLVRELWERIPKGWRIDPGNGFEFDVKAASALASVESWMPEAERALTARFGDLMMAADLPVGWLPEGPDDPILVALFLRAKGRDPS